MTPRLLIFSVLLIFSFSASAQLAVSDTSGGMEVFHPNFNSFPDHHQVITAELDSLTPDSYHDHPEYGVLPYNAPCTDCIELLQKRTPTSRYFVKNGSHGTKFYVQTSADNFNYTDANNRMRSVDPNLQPAGNGLYQASQMPSPATLNATDGTTTLELLPGLPLQFNRDPGLYEVTASASTLLSGNADFTASSVGGGGMKTENIWPGVTREVLFDVNSIETNYLLAAAPAVQPNTWLGFNDKITLPAGYALFRDTITGGTITPDGFWKGELFIADVATGQEVARWSPVFAWDANTSVRGIRGDWAYQVIANGNTYIIRTLISSSWLLDPARVYPVTIDPAVSASATYSAGSIGFSIYSPGNGYCATSTVYCLGGPLNVTFPGGATPTNVVWGASYRAFSPAWMSDGGFRFVGPCGEDPANTNNWYSCNANASGTCSGSGFNAPWLITCVTPSCSNQTLSFYVKNIDCFGWASGCSAAYLRTVNNTWTVTVSGSTLQTLGNTATGSGSTNVTATCCTSTTLDPQAQYGVPGYTYAWSTGATSSTISFYSCTNGTYNYTVNVTDACGAVRTASITVTVSSCVLPVEMLYVRGDYQDDKDRVHIEWATATESNNDYFVIERTTDGVTYAPVATVSTKAVNGNSTQPLEYECFDTSPPTGTVYYRLKQVDRSGDVKDGGTISVQVNPIPVSGVSIQPNPATASVLIGYSATVEGTTQIVILDQFGREVKNIACNARNGANSCEIDLSDLANGVYTVQVRTGAEVMNGKLIRQ